MSSEEYTTEEDTEVEQEEELHRRRCSRRSRNLACTCTIAVVIKYKTYKGYVGQWGRCIQCEGWHGR